MTITAIDMPSFKNITKTYCGKTGCACGCKGSYVAPLHGEDNYWTPKSDRTVKTRLNKILKALKEDPASVLVESGLDGETIWEYEYGNENEYGDRRVIRIYATRD